jgi:hypothetical protein
MAGPESCIIGTDALVTPIAKWLRSPPVPMEKAL